MNKSTIGNSRVPRPGTRGVVAVGLLAAGAAVITIGIATAMQSTTECDCSNPNYERPAVYSDDFDIIIDGWYGMGAGICGGCELCPPSPTYPIYKEKEMSPCGTSAVEQVFDFESESYSDECVSVIARGVNNSWINVDAHTTNIAVALTGLPNLEGSASVACSQCWGAISAGAGPSLSASVQVPFTLCDETVVQVLLDGTLLNDCAHGHLSASWSISGGGNNSIWIDNSGMQMETDQFTLAAGTYTLNVTFSFSVGDSVCANCPDNSSKSFDCTASLGATVNVHF